MTAEILTAAETRLQKLRSALQSGGLPQVGGLINALHPAEIGNLLESLPPAEREVVWELVDRDIEGDVLVELNDEVRTKLIEDMDAEELLAAIDGMEVDDLADLIADLPETITLQILRSMDHQDRERLSTVMAYPEDSAGGLMNTDTVTVRPDVSLEVVLRYTRQRKEIPQGTDLFFVVDRNDRYLGSLDISCLITNDPQTLVSELIDKDLQGILPETPASDVASLFEDRDLRSAPVVDEDGRLLGRITVDDVVDVIREEAEHSLMSMAGLDEEDDMFAGVFTSSRRRAVWLGINLATAFLAAWVVGLFQATLAQVVALAVLMPIVASMGGVAGNQTLILMIRGMALGQVEKSNARWLMLKETAVGLLNGLGWATVVALAVIFWFQDWRIGAVIGAAMIINLMVAAASGVIVPIVLKRMDVDPALAGGVVLTTITDVVGFMSFLGLGTLFLT
ncbi:MAG: magnesium transporter [Proteobacteria bacterium]|nr:magnesium transporter [Pseudomonadota bacterium]